YSHQVYDAMQGCLSCKACVSQCPVQIDIPALKSQFLHSYHSRYLRSLRDYLTASIETISYWQAQFPSLANTITKNRILQEGINQILGIVDLPEISGNSLKKELSKKKVPKFTLERLSNLTELERKNSVILIQDAFTSFYEPNLVIDTYNFLSELGYNVYIAPFFINGKPLHMKGFLGQFKEIAQKNISYLQQLAPLDIPLVGIEPSIVLTYRNEYVKIAGGKGISDRVKLIQEFLLEQGEFLPQIPTKNVYYLLGHCNEKSLSVKSQKQWQEVFKKMGISLNLISTGCCGMAGIYGHESEHYQYSQEIYQSSWQKHLPTNPEDRQYFLVTGYSCRSQVKRFSGWLPSHPIQGLLANLELLSQ
ncbi:MAG TPA: glycerol-3-phosphate dehydrogenase, partial [Cyanothece sp. UBA12306]|nr:glycerol-3-phosphate dehydrogenase [Cyanothece sp. UBA12306]